MEWAIIVLSLLTVFLIGWAVHANANVRHAEDNFDVAFLVICAGAFGFIDFVLIIVWLAVT